jgi:hypothetical protein
VAGGSAGAQGSFEGLVQLIVDPTSFKLAGYTVVHGASTLYKAGNVDDLDAGVRVEVEGTFSSATTLNARRIEFILPSIRFRAPVLPAQVVPEASITILGNTVHNNLHNRDEDGIMAGGLAVTTHLEVRAYQDSLGQLYATRVRSRGAPDPNDYNLQAPVESIARPNLIALGLTIDTASSTFQDNAHASITADQFFAAVALGTLVEIEEANFDSVNHRLYGGIVFLSDDGAAGSLRPQGAIPQNASVGGTLSIISLDMVFTNSFEAP